MIGDADAIGIACLREPVRTAMLETANGARREAREWNPRVAEEMLPYRFLGVAVASESPGMLGAEHDHGTGRENYVVVAERGHRANDMVEYFRPGLTPV